MRPSSIVEEETTSGSGPAMHQLGNGEKTRIGFVSQKRGPSPWRLANWFRGDRENSGSNGRVEIRTIAMKGSYETIELRTERSVAILALNRPSRLNAINKAMLEELQHALDAIEKDQNVRA